MRSFRSGLAALVLATAFVAPAVHAEYILTEVIRPGATTTALWDVNNSGVMVGYSIAGSGPSDFSSAFIYDGITFTSLSGPAGAISSNATGISDTGTVVGSYSLGGGTDASGNILAGPSTGFLYTGGSYVSFSVAGATDTFLRGISPDGRYITGYYTTDTVAGIGFAYDTLTGIFTTVSTPSSFFTIAQGVTSAGVLVGGDLIVGPPTTRPGFIYDLSTGIRTDVELAGAVRTSLRAIDDAGTLAGWFTDAGNAQHGFVGSITDFVQIDFTGASATFVEGSNNAGTLVGTFLVGDRSGAYIAYKVPEPGTLALLAAALAVATLIRRLGWARMEPARRPRSAGDRLAN